jgi:hypothetical protein
MTKSGKFRGMEEGSHIKRNAAEKRRQSSPGYGVPAYWRLRQSLSLSRTCWRSASALHGTRGQALDLQVTRISDGDPRPKIQAGGVDYPSICGRHPYSRFSVRNFDETSVTMELTEKVLFEIVWTQKH